MTLKKGTIAAQIRDKIDLMHALIVSGKKDGGEFSYGEVLVLAGLPSNHSYVRELSNQLIARGYRRHAAKQPKPAPVPTEETLPGIDGAQEGPTLQSVLDMNQALWQMKSALDELTAAFDQLCDRYNALTGQEAGEE